MINIDALTPEEIDIYKRFSYKRKFSLFREALSDSNFSDLQTAGLDRLVSLDKGLDMITSACVLTVRYAASKIYSGNSRGDIAWQFYQNVCFRGLKTEDIMDEQHYKDAMNAVAMLDDSDINQKKCLEILVRSGVYLNYESSSAKNTEDKDIVTNENNILTSINLGYQQLDKLAVLD